MSVELEDLNNFRFYKLKVDPHDKCDKCGGMLWLFRHDGSIYKRCRHTDCLAVFEIIRHCSYCGKKHDFEDVTCDRCESKVINLTTLSVTIDECDKALKKINRAFKKGVMTEEEWKNARKYNIEEQEKCRINLEKLKSEIGIFH